MKELSISKIRKELGMSQQELADKIGVHINTIISWEKNGFHKTRKHANHDKVMEIINKIKSEKGKEKSEYRIDNRGRVFPTKKVIRT